MRDILYKSKNIIFLASIICIIFLGIFLRTHGWIYACPLYSDESCLLSNSIVKDFFKLFLPQDYAQCTPPIFMIFVRILYSTFGLNEIALRFPTYFYSIGSLIIFAILAYKIFKNKLSVLVSTFIFAFSPRLIYFTSVLKQYTCDAFFTVLILLIGLIIKDKTLSKLNLFLLSILSVICVLNSYTSIFVILTVIMTLFIYNFKKNKSINFSTVLYYFLPLTAIMAVYFFINCLPTIQNEVLQRDWSGNSYCLNIYFIPTNFDHILNFFKFFNCNGEIFKTYVDGYTFFNIYLSIIAVIASFFIWYKNNKFIFGLLTFPFILAILLGLLHLYPFSPERIIVYLIPIYVLFLAKPLDYCAFDKKILSSIILVFYFFLINFSEIYKFSNEYTSNLEHVKVSTAKTFIDFLYHAEVTPKDYILISSVNEISFDFYDTKKLFKQENIISDNFTDTEQLEKLPANSVIFIYYDEKYLAFERISDWMKKECKILYKIDGYNCIFYKCKKIK